MPEPSLSHILGFAGYGVARWQADKARGRLTLGLTRTGKTPYHTCSEWGIGTRDPRDHPTRRVRDLPGATGTVWLGVPVYRVECARWGVGTARIPFLAGRPPRTARREAAGAQDRAAAPGSRVAAQGGLAPSTGRRIDQRALQAWAAGRPRKPLRSLGVDEICLGKGTQCLPVGSTLATGEPLGMGRERKRETLDRFFAEALPPPRRRAVRAVCGDLGEPFVQRLRAPLPQARIVYDQFPVLRHAHNAGDEVRRVEFFRQGGAARGLVRGKRWLRLRRWAHRTADPRRTLQARFALNRRLGRPPGSRSSSRGSGTPPPRGPPAAS